MANPDNLFKIFREFEEKLDMGFHIDSQTLNRSVSIKRERSNGAKSR